MNREGPKEVVLDKGYHSNEVLAELADWQVRSYCSEPDRGRRRWEGEESRTSGGVRQPATDSGRTGEAAVAAAGREAGAEICALL